ncbi:MAG TPA: CAP domain-containing protein, partial [Herpetosiphonaceae bacterium]|nr:CAP domain-containing protein [Herpetosiphonaceae bacterium]
IVAAANVPTATRTPELPTATQPPASPTAPPVIEPPTAAPPVIEPPTAIPAPTDVPLPAEVREIIELVNEQRAIRGVAPLNVSAELVAAAQSHSEDMAANDFLSDTGSDGAGPDARIRRAGYIFSAWAEHIAGGFSEPFDVVQSWVGDPSRLETMIGADMRDVGVGYAANANSQYGRYWTILYARP